MTKQQYADYQREVHDFLTSNHVKPGCFSPVEPDAAPYFTWRPCGCCGSTLGGDRETYRFVTTQDDTFEAEVCTDCVYYLIYGQLDDMTMIEIEQSS